MSKTDAELMIEFRDGNDEAFAELVERYKVPLMNYFYRLMWDRHLAEDCCQEVFCRVFRHRNDYEPRASFASYLYRIGRNLWIDMYRSQKNSPQSVSLDRETEDCGPVSAIIEGTIQDPSQGSETDDEVRRVKRALRLLPPDLRETLVLVKYQGLKYHEAAEALGIPIGTVRSRIHTALEQVRAALNVHVDGKQ